MPKFILKILILTGVIFLMPLFSSCKLLYSDNSDENIAKEYSNQLVAAINSSDEKSIAKLFAERSYVLGTDDGGTVIDFFKNGIKTVPAEYLGVGSEEEMEDGKVIKTIQYEICVEDLTTKKQYNFLFIQCTRDSLNPKNEGIITLLIYNVDDAETFTNWWRSFDSSKNPKGIQLLHFD